MARRQVRGVAVPCAGLLRRGVAPCASEPLRPHAGAGTVDSVGASAMKIRFIARQAVILAASLAPLFATPAHAIDGQVLITHAKAVAGGVTPGDAPGYPVTISLTGSYKLGGNLQAPVSKNGIEVNAVEVTIDLNGFRINGDRTTGSNGVGVVGTQRNLQLRNGTIRNFKISGVEAGHGLIVRDMNISENGVSGVALFAPSGYARIVNSTIVQNGGYGVECFVACHIEGSIIGANSGGGLKITTSGTVLGNTITGNGFYGIVAVVGSKVGVGNNTVVDNSSGPISGSFIRLHPNACVPACP